MKIIQINTVCDRGSVGRIAVDLCLAVEKNQGTALLAYGRGKAVERVPCYYFGSKKETGIQVLMQFIWGTNGKGSKRATNRLLKKIREFKPDVIHLHNIHGFVLNYELLFTFLKRYGKPVVWTLHDCFPFTGHCAYFDYQNCDRWKTQCESCPQYRSGYPYGLLRDNSHINYREKKEWFTGVPDLTIVTPSGWLKNLVGQSFLKDYPVKVIYNGIDLSVFKPPQVGSDEYGNTLYKDKTVILGVANVWEARKGYRFFEELAKHLDRSYQIILVGLTKKQIKALPPEITGIMRTGDSRELARLYARADFFLNPTLEDNFPTTNLEALACGTPVITFRTGGSVESVTENTGIIVEKGDLKGLIRAVTENRGRFTSEACRDRARFFNKEERFREYIDLYQSISTGGEKDVATESIHHYDKL